MLLKGLAWTKTSLSRRLFNLKKDLTHELGFLLSIYFKTVIKLRRVLRIIYFLTFIEIWRILRFINSKTFIGIFLIHLPHFMILLRARNYRVRRRLKWPIAYRRRITTVEWYLSAVFVHLVVFVVLNFQINLIRGIWKGIQAKSIIFISSKST